jgi:3-dehydroquinate synthase
MLAACALGAARGVCTRADQATVAGLIAQLGPLPPLGDLSAAAQLDLMRRDKKVVDGRLHVVLPTGIGASTVVNDVTETELLAALSALGLGE